jgi:hypothetical protein
MALDQQLARIKDKDDLHRWIDELPDDTRALILVDADEHYEYRELGELTVAEIVYMCESLKWEVMEQGDDGDDDE